MQEKLKLALTVGVSAVFALLIIPFCLPLVSIDLPVGSISQITKRTGLTFPTGSRVIEGVEHYAWHRWQIAAIEVPSGKLPEFLASQAVQRLEKVERYDAGFRTDKYQVTRPAAVKKYAAFEGAAPDGSLLTVMLALDNPSHPIVYTQYLKP